MDLRFAKALVVGAAFAACAASAQTLSAPALVSALRQGGYVIVMRHAHAPEVPPSTDETDRANRNHERQLDETGRTSARAMGSALRALRLPIGTVWSSATYRATETLRLAGLRAPEIATELGDGGRSMQAASSEEAAWLKAHVNEKPRPGTDTVIVTQYPNVLAAFGDAAAGMNDGEALVFRPSGGNAPHAVGRIAIERWPLLVKQLKHAGKERHHGA